MIVVGDQVTVFVLKMGEAGSEANEKGDERGSERSGQGVGDGEGTSSVNETCDLTLTSNGILVSPWTKAETALVSLRTEAITLGSVQDEGRVARTKPARAHASWRICCSAVSEGRTESMVSLGAKPISRRPEAKASLYLLISEMVLYLGEEWVGSGWGVGGEWVGSGWGVGGV